MWYNIRKYILKLRGKVPTELIQNTLWNEVTNTTDCFDLIAEKGDSDTGPLEVSKRALYQLHTWDSPISREVSTPSRTAVSS